MGKSAAVDLAWAERKLLAHCAFDDASWGLVADRVSASDFLDARGQRTYAAIAAQAEDGESRDVVSVSRRIRAEDGDLAPELGAYLGELLDHVVPTYGHAAVVAWARMIREEARRRQARSAALTLADDAMDASGDPQQAIAAAHETLTRLSVQAWEDDADEDRSLGTTTDHLLSLYAGNPDVGRLHTGFHCLDRVLTTLRPTTLTVVAGLTSGGKTALTLQIADQIAATGAGVLFTSLEMGADEIQGRRLCRAACIPESVYRRWEAGPPDVIQRTRTAEADLRVRPFEVQAGSFSLAEIRAMARRRKARSGLALLVVDYLGLVTVGGKYDNREQEVNAVARGLKACAMELQIAVIAVAQLNREASKAAANDAPGLATLRDSGSVEQHANTVLMVHRDGRDDRGVLTLTLRKQRGGSLGAVKLVFTGDTYAFSEYGGAQEFDARTYQANR